MTWHAYVDAGNDYFLGHSVRLVLVDRHPDGSVTVVNGDGTLTRHTDPMSAPPEPVGFRVSADALHALLGALSRHLGAVEHPEQLRRDYEHERGRVDKLINNLIGGAS